MQHLPDNTTQVWALINFATMPHANTLIITAD